MRSIICTCGVSVGEEHWGNHLKSAKHKKRLALIRAGRFPLQRQKRRKRRWSCRRSSRRTLATV